MALLLNELGYHIQLTKINADKEEKFLFPINTVDDVIVNEDGTGLNEFLPTVENDFNNPTEKSPLSAVYTSQDTITAELLDAIVSA